MDDLGGVIWLEDERVMHARNEHIWKNGEMM